MTATSTGSDGVHARSTGDNVTVTIEGGTISGDGDSIEIEEGATNRVLNFGTITNDFDAGASTAIRGGSGDETVDNYDVVTGNVDLGGGTNIFNNWEEGLFESGETVVADTLWNRGILSPGGMGNVLTTDLTGDFDQADLSPGTIEIDVDFAATDPDTINPAGDADLLNVSGDAAVGGFIQGRVMNVDSFAGGPQTFRVINTGGTLTNPGLILALNTAVVDFDEVVNTGAGTVDLVVNSIDFAPVMQGLSDNETEIGDYLNDLLDDPNFDPATDTDEEGIENYLDYLANLLTGTELAAGLDALSPAIYDQTSYAVSTSALSFTEGLLSCPTANEGSGAEVFIKEGRCFWARGTGRTQSVDGDDGASSFDEDALGISGGVQVAINPNLFAGFGLGYEHSQIDSDSGASAEGDIGHVGASMKWINGPYQLGGTVYGGGASYDVTRDIPMMGEVDGSADLYYVGARLRAAMVLGSDSLYLKPMVDFDIMNVHRNSSDEGGDTGLDLLVDGEDDFIASVAPAVEVGAQMPMEFGVIRPFVRGGVRFFANNDFSTTAAFADTDAGGSFTVSNDFGSIIGEVSAGVDVLANGNSSLRLSYDGRFSDEVEQHGASVKYRYGF